MAPRSDVRPPSRLSAEDVAAAATRVGEPGFVDGRLHWLGSAADGSGGMVLRAVGPDGTVRDESPPGVSLRSRLYGYGAGSWCATPLGLVGVESATQRLAVVTAGGVELVGPDVAGSTCGDPASVPATAWVVVAAEHPGDADGPARRGLGAIDVASGAWHWLVSHAGRCAEPQVSPDAATLAWLEWPDRSMPWERAVLRVATLEHASGSIACRGARRVDGGRGSSVGQPTWRRDGSLAYVSEAAGWWQPWCCDTGGVVRRLSGRRAEFQRPRWLTCRWLAEAGDEGALGCAFADVDGEHVAVLGPDGALEVLDQPCVRVDGLAADARALGWVGASVQAQGLVLTAELSGRDNPTTPKAAPTRAVGLVRAVVTGDVPEPPAPVPERFRFVHEDVALDGVLWRPAVVDGAHTEPVPLVVTVHPGPTGAVDRSYAPAVHLLCSNGLAVAAIDSSGSTAHGRSHRERLDGCFGVLDVAECAAAATHLVAAGVAMATGLFVRGTSAGGTTALLALATSVFRGAVAWYPASSLEDEAEGFEAGYLATLLGAASPSSRSPLALAATLRGSVLVVQGALDEIVGVAETQRLVEALRAADVDVELVVVDGEGHGFRTSTGRAVALGAELDFYRRVLGWVDVPVPGAQYDASRSGHLAPGDHAS